MARRVISIDEKIEKAQAAVIAAKEKYDALVEAGLDDLLTKAEKAKMLEGVIAKDKAMQEKIKEL